MGTKRLLGAGNVGVGWRETGRRREQGTPRLSTGYLAKGWNLIFQTGGHQTGRRVRRVLEEGVEGSGGLEPGRAERRGRLGFTGRKGRDWWVHEREERNLRRNLSSGCSGGW